MDDPDRLGLLARARKLAAEGRFGETKALLARAVDGPRPWPDDDVTVGALLEWARAHRHDHELSEARRVAGRALDVACRIGQQPLQAVALEGLGLIEVADGRLRGAGELFLRSADLERQCGDLDGMAAALNNYAHMLVTHGIEGAEEVLRRALAAAAPDSVLAAVLGDHLASEMERQGRHAEATELTRSAVATFTRLGQHEHRYKALRNLARHLADAGDTDGAAAVFEEAHDLVHVLRMNAVDDSHYAEYWARVAAVEQESETVVRQRGENPLVIGVYATLASAAYGEGLEALESGRYGDAAAALHRANEHWLAIGAWHEIVAVEHHLALVACEIGDARTALVLARRVRAAARDLGDAWREVMAVVLMVRLRHAEPSIDGLDLLAQARALIPIATRQLGLEVTSAPWAVDGGVIDLEAAHLCSENHAPELAERFLESAVAAARTLPTVSRHRLAFRLAGLHGVLLKRGRDDRAEAILEELLAIATELNDPRVDRAIALCTAGQAYQRGETSEALLEALLNQCRQYEGERALAHGAGGLEGFAEELDPPYEEAADVALELGRPALALTVLELGKARTLMESLGAEVPDVPAPGDCPVFALQGATGLGLFAGRAGIHLLRVDGTTGAVTSRLFSERPVVEAVDGFISRLGRLVDAGDSERSLGADLSAAIDEMLSDSTFRELSQAIDAAAAPGPTYVAPHRFLHHAPLQLVTLPGGVVAPAATTVVPALCVVPLLPHSPSGHGTTAVGGDPLGDLPFARAEAVLVAGADAELVCGDDFDGEWLRRAANDPDLRVLHVACHGRFDRARPDRSGLVLAEREAAQLPEVTAARLFTTEDVAALSFTGAVVALSACSTGLQSHREGDEAAGLVDGFLRAGASALVVAQWPVPDLSAMLLMVDFHDRLRKDSTTTPIRALLGAAQARLAGLTARDLVELGFALADRLLSSGAAISALTTAAGCISQAHRVAGDSNAAARAEGLGRPVQTDADPTPRLDALRTLVPARSDDRYGTRPFSHPRHWGAFTIIGHGIVGGD